MRRPARCALFGSIVGRLEVLGEPVPVVEQVLTKPNGAADFSVSRHGTLVHVPG